MVTDEPICVRCARYMRTCCQTSQVYVTLGDVRRIAEHTGEDDFCEFRVPDDPIYVTSHADDPVWRQFVFRRDGTRRVLRREADGSCVFLGPHGCTLPGDVRPLLCRLYPYDFNEREIYHTLARGCPLELLRPQESLTEALDMNLEMAEIWHRQLYQEIREEEPGGNLIRVQGSGFRVQDNGAEEVDDENCAVAYLSETGRDHDEHQFLNPEP